MINQIANNKPSGYQSNECDAGIPISGRTDINGSYQILKLNANGSLAPSSTPISSTASYIGINPTAIALVVGAPALNTYLGTAPVFGATTISEGLYAINPAFMFQGTVAGGLNFVLYKQTTNLDSYIATLPPFNIFAPALTDLATGLCGFWHNSALQNLGATTVITYNRNNTLNCYLDAGIYSMAIFTEAGVNITSVSGLFGFFEFTKIG
jgi:hypothetical protein